MIMAMNLIYAIREPYFKYNEKVVSFRDPEEWRREMDRTNCKGWRLTYQNQRFQLSSRYINWR